ncbi:ribosomal protein L4 [Pseudovirgaria hyperparasitica]|uniref:Large ribosomal subunit protein uL4m n=1 Tax=Pseudovirgaria hyperparasitica TaxID=470096 RepID=A0A6A6W9R6_9PEZI|nr:ribosomal protein L4 [Pseudovirgaria hyperparasitica]KAF2758899.1 ribosomal protein L4 [Pseudovirgaria hyperparasitica]
MIFLRAVKVLQGRRAKAPTGFSSHLRTAIIKFAASPTTLAKTEMAAPKGLWRSISCIHTSGWSTSMKVSPIVRRNITTELPLEHSYKAPAGGKFPLQVPEHIRQPNITTTIYSFPELEPLRFEQFPADHLHLPLRKDILHRAVIFEGDNTRLGTASTKWRREVHGSTKKVHPQKGMGKARVGDKKSPIRRGGGVAFGPKPRDFGTELPQKVYDLAWRTALSYRYRKGELTIVDGTIEVPPNSAEDTVRKLFGDDYPLNPSQGGNLVVSCVEPVNLAKAMEYTSRYGLAVSMLDVDVKDLLKQGRIVIELQALKILLASHASDLQPARAKLLVDR